MASLGELLADAQHGVGDAVDLREEGLGDHSNTHAPKGAVANGAIRTRCGVSLLNGSRRSDDVKPPLGRFAV
jgi:hypothetical protein